MQNKTSRAGFTLIELLVVMTIIGMLAALILPGLSRSQQKAWQTGCQANMKNISTALHGWIEDHNGWLPPGTDGQAGVYGLWCNQIPDCNSGDKYHLTYYLATYLGGLAPSSKTYLVPQFICPSFRRYGQNFNMSGRVAYARTAGYDWGKLSGEANFDPFGYAIGGDSSSPPMAPRKLQAVADIIPLANVWVLVDADQVGFLNNGWGEAGGLPPQPSHVDQRNYVFFDGHVAAKPILPPGQM